MYLYNSATHKKEELKTHTPNHVEMYTCGPTVYHFAHIGNLRSYIMEDVLEKYLRFAGYSVNRVMNITDVGHLTSDADEGEDKMLKGAKREHKSVMEIAQFYTDAFFADCQKLHIKRPDVVQPATGLIDINASSRTACGCSSSRDLSACEPFFSHTVTSIPLASSAWRQSCVVCAPVSVIKNLILSIQKFLPLHVQPSGRRFLRRPELLFGSAAACRSLH